MVRTAALVFGIVFVIIGILGFFPAFAPNNHLFGIFEIGPLHNWVHLLSGAAALISASSYNNARLYFKVFGVVYGLVTVLGIFYLDRDLLGIMNHNIADIFLHAFITAGALYFGFSNQRDDRVTPTSTTTM